MIRSKSRNSVVSRAPEFDPLSVVTDIESRPSPLPADLPPLPFSTAYPRPTEQAAKLDALRAELQSLEVEADAAYRAGDGQKALDLQQRRYVLSSTERQLAIDAATAEVDDAMERYDELRSAAEPYDALVNELRLEQARIHRALDEANGKASWFLSAYGIVVDQRIAAQKRADRLENRATPLPAAPIEEWVA